MGMTKIILPGSYDFGEAATQLIKVSNRGLVGSDLQQFIKRAGAGMADAVRSVKFYPGEIPIHSIALGATEAYGPNRNGDGFTEQTCRDYHNTFVKHARWYRNHQNKDPKKSYGIIKYSAYNEAMRRIELLVALNGTKEAAARNGGLVADKELEKIASGKGDWGVSMACKVAHDVCSMCGNKARTRDEYCRGIDEGGTCEGGGCYSNLCKVAEDGSITYVDNPRPKWFDLSDVYRPADRIAFVMGQMQKAASAGITLSGAELANQFGVTAPFDLEITGISDYRIMEQLKLARDLADIEAEIMTPTGFTKSASAPVTVTHVPGLDAHIGTGRKVAAVLKALAREKIALSLADFIQLAVNSNRGYAERMAKEVAPYVPGVFGRMCDDVEKLAEDLQANPFRPQTAEPSQELQIWAEKVACDASLDMRHVQKRAWRQAINEQPVKPRFNVQATNKSEACDNIAKAYGLYKLAFLYEIRDTDPSFMLTANLAVRQNHVS